MFIISKGNILDFIDIHMLLVVLEIELVLRSALKPAMVVCQVSDPFLNCTILLGAREYHNHKPQPFPDTKRKRKQTKSNKRKSNKRTKSNKISSLFPKRGNRNAKRTEKHKNKITQAKT